MHPEFGAYQALDIVRFILSACQMAYQAYAVHDAWCDRNAIEAAGVNGATLSTTRTSFRNELTRLYQSCGYFALVIIVVLGVQHPVWANYAGAILLMSIQVGSIRNSIDSRRNRKRVIDAGKTEGP